MSEDNEKYWHSVYELYKESSKQYDRNVLYIASGALGLSMTFIKDIVDFTNVECKILLMISWFVLVGVILMSLISHYFSMKALNQKLATINDDNDPKSKWLDEIVGILNLLMLIFLPFGIMMLFIFIYINI
jgi:hypothetical protein